MKNSLNISELLRMCFFDCPLLLVRLLGYIYFLLIVAPAMKGIKEKQRYAEKRRGDLLNRFP